MTDNLKHFSLIEEFKTAHKLIRLGFGELQNIDGSNDFYFLPFQLLSQGFERLMKAYICAAYFYQNQKYPDFKYLKDLSHDLDKLLAEITTNYFVEHAPTQFAIDYKFLIEDQDFKHLLYIISEFGKLARYYHFNVITGSQKPSINTEQLWTEFESKIIKDLGIDKEKIFDLDPNSINDVYAKIGQFIIIKFESFVSALSRQIIFKTAGTHGVQMSGDIYTFGLLYPDEFGITDYRKITISYRDKLAPAKPFTLIDKLNRELNPQIKYRTITKQEYKGDWPFYADKVTVQCERKTWCTIIIEKRWYSLNGSAKGKYKIDNPHDGGVAILGKSLGEFITIARSL